MADLFQRLFNEAQLKGLVQREMLVPSHAVEMQSIIILSGLVAERSEGECLSERRGDGNLTTQLQHCEQCAVANQWNEAAIFSTAPLPTLLLERATSLTYQLPVVPVSQS